MVRVMIDDLLHLSHRHRKEIAAMRCERRHAAGTGLRSARGLPHDYGADT
jgi:hypothetical protein